MPRKITLRYPPWVSTTATLDEEHDVGKVYDGRLLRRLLGYVRPYWKMAAAAVSLIILSSLLQLVGPLVTALALDRYIAPVEGPRSGLQAVAAGQLEKFGLLDVPATTGVALAAAVYLAAILGTFLTLFVQSYVMGLMGQLIMRDLRRDIFGHLQRLPVSYFDHRPVGRLVTRSTNDVASLNELFTSGLVSIFGDVVLLAGIVTVLFALDWRLALVSFAVLPLLGGLTLWFKMRARRSYREVRVKLAKINAFLQEHISGMGLVQLFGQQDSTRSEFRRRDDAHREAHVRTIYYYAIYYPAVELITAFGMAVVLGVGGRQILGGALTLGALVAFLQYVQRFYQPLADLSEKYNILQSAMASSERIFELLDAPVEIESPPDAHRPRAVTGAVEFDRVTFSYKPGEEILRNLSFRIEPGETLAVVGHTGAGKSTLASLLLRFYDVDSGTVRIDGVDVRGWDVSALRGSIAMVLQDVFLFSGDLEHNIRLGRDDLDRSQVIDALREVDALDFVEKLPDGLETVLQERGGGLSVGQKQLVAFARALAFDPRILILDEATASVDSETEARIQGALDRLLVDRTSLVIAHRLSTVRRADRILVLHRGEVREVGSHEELLARGGIYSKLYELQFRGEEAIPA
ncbi:MAG: ABC transporter ATP-binding protein [Acidobacteriota bacterium]